MIYKTNSGYGVNFNQLVQNGNFVNDSGWFSVEGTKSISNNEAILPPSSSASYPGIGRTIGTTISGHKYLVFLQFKGENKLALNCGGLNAQIVSGLDIANYNNVGYIFTSTASNTNFTFFVVNGRNSQYYKNVCLFDLTQMFGSGNEPTTVAEFREMYPDDYYDYTLSQWQWAKKGKITSYITPVIENGTTLLPIEHHIVGLAKNGIDRIEIEGNSYQNGTPTPTSPIPIQSFNGTGDTVKLVGAGGKELQLPNSITLNNQTISLELNKVGTYADKLIIDKASGKVELVRNTGKQNLGLLTWYKGYEVSGSKTYYSFLFYALMSNSSPNLPNTKYPVVAYANRGQDKSLSCEVASNVCIITDSDYDNTTALQTSLNNVFVYYALKSNYPTTTDITNATYQINGITYNVSDWLNFVDREIEIETDGLAQSNLSVDYEPTLIYNYAKRELPVGFVRLDYIESTGEQFIDTGYKITATTDITIRFINDDTGSLPTTPFGVVGDTNIGYVSTWAYWRIYDTVGYYPSGGHFTGNHEFKVIGNKLYVDGVDSGYTGGTPQNIYTYDLYLFGKNNNGTLANSKGCVIYYCKLYDNDTLVRNFIPCYRYSDGIEGLYDTVGKQFYTNQGTGRFIRGKEIDSGNLLDLSKFVRGCPSDTASATTTKRTFTENTWVLGLATNNLYWAGGGTYSCSINDQTIIYTVSGGHGVGLVKKLRPNTTYRLFGHITSTTSLGTVKIMYYEADGTFMDGVAASLVSDTDITFTTTSSDFGYSVILLTPPTATGGTITFSNISLHEVN